MLALMIFHTIFGLWIISRPIAEEQETAEDVPQPFPIEDLRQPPMPDPP